MSISLFFFALSIPNLQEILILLAVGFATGFINTVAGGGSLITLPVLMLMGLPHTVANGTNRVGILIQSISALAGFKSKSVTSFPIGMHQGLSSVVGSIIGTMLALVVDAKSFNLALSAVMLMVIVLTIYEPKKKNKVINYQSKGRYILSMILFFGVGIYGGFIQAGLGFLSMTISMIVNGFNIHKSNHAKIFVTFCITVVAFSIFLFNGKILWLYGIPLALSSALGAWVSSRWSVQKEEGTIKAILIISILILAFKLLFPETFDSILDFFMSLWV